MIGFDKTITIYNQRYDPATRETTWPKIVINGCSWTGHQRVTIGEGLTSNDGYSVRIPLDSVSIADTYPLWQAGVEYSVGDVVKYGVNQYGKPQLYKVLQYHTSQADWTPATTPTLYGALDIVAGGFLPQDKYRELADPTGYWTAQNGDYVVLGEGVSVVNGITDITRKYTDCFKVTTVNTANIHRLLPHLRIEGK